MTAECRQNSPLRSHHLDHLNAAKDRLRARHGPETGRGLNSLLGGTMILHNLVVQIGAMLDANRLQLVP